MTPIESINHQLAETLTLREDNRTLNGMVDLLVEENDRLERQHAHDDAVIAALHQAIIRVYKDLDQLQRNLKAVTIREVYQ